MLSICFVQGKSGSLPGIGEVGMQRAFLALTRFLLGLMLIPGCCFISRVLLGLFHMMAETAGDSFIPLSLMSFCVGFLVWILMYIFLPRPIRSYVLAHELTHATWGLVMGARVSKLQVREDGGSVTLSKSNIWITLAPYFFPFYAVIITFIYSALACFWDVERWYAFWLGIVGFAWGFHCTFTISSLLQHQTDVQEYGYVLSYTLIYIINACVVCVGIVAVSTITLEQLTSQCVADSRWTWMITDLAWRSCCAWVKDILYHLQ
jgi:hypothetical protein